MPSRADGRGDSPGVRRAGGVRRRRRDRRWRSLRRRRGAATRPLDATRIEAGRIGSAGRPRPRRHEERTWRVRDRAQPDPPTQPLPWLVSLARAGSPRAAASWSGCSPPPRSLALVVAARLLAGRFTATRSARAARACQPCARASTFAPEPARRHRRGPVAELWLAGEAPSPLSRLLLPRHPVALVHRTRSRSGDAEHRRRLRPPRAPRAAATAHRYRHAPSSRPGSSRSSTTGRSRQNTSSA